MSLGWKTILGAAIAALMQILKVLGLGDAGEGLGDTTSVIETWINVIQALAAFFGAFGLRDAIKKLGSG